MADKSGSISINDSWQKRLAILIDHHRMRSFPATLQAFMATLCAFDTFLMVTFKESFRPIIIHPTDPQQHSQTLHHYLEQAYVLDPLFNALQNGLRPGVSRLAEIMPDSFESTEYYQSCYREFGFQDEINLTINLDEQVTCVISLGRRSALSSFTRAEVKHLNEFYPIINSLVRQFWISRSSEFVQYQRSAGPMKQALSTFASGVLTQREREVNELILRGFSSRAIAETLNISTGTLKVHRKNIHARLKTSTQSEIFSLFLNHWNELESRITDTDQS